MKKISFVTLMSLLLLICFSTESLNAQSNKTDKNGLRQMGIINYNTHGYYDGPVALNVLSSICLSPDEKYLAIGSADRIACVCVVEI